jgi:Flp pilus assembly protein TadB
MNEIATPGGSTPEPTRSSAVSQQQTGGSLMPEQPIMKKQTYSAVMSYAGSSRRLWAWTHGWGSKNLPLSVLAWSTFTVALAVTWAIVTVWYAFTILIFWWLLFPFRLMRRSQRKQEAYQKQQLATMQAMLVNQQRALNDMNSESK